MGLGSEAAGASAPVNMVAVESFLLASGWQRNASGKLAPPGLAVGRTVAGSSGQDRGLALPTAGAGRDSLRGGTAR